LALSFDWQVELKRAERAALAAGALLKATIAGEKKILAEPGRDIKLQADRDAEAIILDQLRDSAFEVLAEESGESAALDPSKPFWIVDPLDGTLNFSRSIPFLRRLHCAEHRQHADARGGL
jgi:myo-inositol-1(or 4)-monophosphatase